MHLGIRADGGPDIGYGHLVRSSALAESVLDDDGSVTVVTTTPKHASDVFPEAVSVVQLSARNDPEPFLDWLRTADVDVVFTDAYPIDTDYQRAVREVVPLIVLQDDARHTVCADAFVNGNLYAAELDYEFDGEEPECHLGPEYALLRSEIRRYALEEPPWRETAERALVTMGGSDLTNLTPDVVRAFDGLDLHVDATVGPGFSPEQEREIRQAASDVSANVRVARDPDDLPERMFQADFAVCTASTTTYELLALGTPFVAVPVVDNQEPIGQALEERKLATVLSRETPTDDVIPAIERLAADTEFRTDRRERGRELVDGRGAERIAGVALSLPRGRSET